ncbi:hypothetical protein H072_10628 [Dactylellina haptotyla CBS 200.50]|uniref:Uncharacterized protein n=1 Tax=Dactylellina haptotyla (strain CBS 200.50) TaxID=1284197 RepID=S8A463_DACHA|nr:hypothetical protein H072_10628 [Dactylellina haptotyla CBS 200.50]
MYLAGNQLSVTREADRDGDNYWNLYDTAKAAQFEDFLTRVDFKSIESKASSLRGGIPCRIPVFAPNGDFSKRKELALAQTGGQNCNVDVVFEDGVTWLARIKLDDPLIPPKETQNYILTSEYHTLKCLESWNMPTPKVFHYEVDNPTSYILAEKMDGTPLDWYSASPTERTKVMEQLADIYAEVYRHPFTTSGSIVDSNTPGRPLIGGFAQSQTFAYPNEPIGPFTNLEQAASTIIKGQQKMLINREIDSLPVDTYLSHLWRLEALELLNGISSDVFYLRHFDDKGDHLLVDENFNITAVIDWEFASTEIEDFAFSSPCMIWSVGDFYDGKNALSDEGTEFMKVLERKGYHHLGKLVRDGRKFQRFFFFLGGGVAEELEEFKNLFQGLREGFLTEGDTLNSYEDWKAEMLSRYKDDKGLLELLASVKENP